MRFVRADASKRHFGDLGVHRAREKKKRELEGNNVQRGRPGVLLLSALGLLVFVIGFRLFRGRRSEENLCQRSLQSTVTSTDSTGNSTGGEENGIQRLVRRDETRTCVIE